jgi:hypothetical protein
MDCHVVLLPEHWQSLNPFPRVFPSRVDPLAEMAEAPMDPRRFDALARIVAVRPHSRRGALLRFTASVGALLAGAGLGRAPSRAQQSTPVASPAASEMLTEFLYIQSFSSGTLRPIEGADGVFKLVLSGGTGQTVYFADRPERQVGVAPTERVLAAVGFDPANPPNAGLVAQTDDGERVIVVELTNPDLDEAAETLTYDVRPLADYAGEGLRHLAAKQSDEELPETFGPASLFIDHGRCPDRICGGICCDSRQGMVCQGHAAYCVSAYQTGICQGGDICHQRPHTTCNPKGTCYCGTDAEHGGACLTRDPKLCDRNKCLTSEGCAYGKLCIEAGSCCNASVCMPLCQD